MSLYKSVMYLECSPFLEKEGDGEGQMARMCRLFYSSLVSRKMLFCYDALYRLTLMLITHLHILHMLLASDAFTIGVKGTTVLANTIYN